MKREQHSSWEIYLYNNIRRIKGVNIFSVCLSISVSYKKEGFGKIPYVPFLFFYFFGELETGKKN